METDAIDYSNSQAITHTERPRQTESSTIYHIPQESISHTQPPAIQYTQQPVTNYNSERPRQTESSTIYHIPQQSIQHTQPSHNTKPPDENIYLVCTLCETTTRFKNYHRLEMHVKSHHSDFDLNVKGSKRKRVKEEKVFPKKAKWNWT